jgi:hypothetical protein
MGGGNSLMALSRQEVQVTWSASNSTPVTSGSNATSDEVTIDATSVERYLIVKADNGGTPTSGDTIEVKILMNAGDPDADPDSADEFGTAETCTVVQVLDTNAVDPCIGDAIPIPFGQSFKVRVDSNAASNSITVSAQMNEQLSA